MYKLILFDLDGTLADTSEGIYGAYHYSCEQSGIPLNENSLNGVIGGNLLRVFTDRFGLNEQAARKTIAIYRRWYEEHGIWKAKLYPGMKDVLHQLAEKYILGVATLKREDFAKKMLPMLGIDNCFQMICGMDVNDTLDKEQIIWKCMKQADVKPSETLLIGDSESDLNGAVTCGVDFLAVTYGFGFKTDEVLPGQGNVGVIDKAEDITELL